MYKSNQRQALIAKIHIAKNQLKLDEDTYRQMLQGLTGKASCRLMKIADLNKVLEAMKRRGFKAQHKQKRPEPAKHKAIYLAKITALLCQYKLPPSYADSVAKQAFGVDFVHWLSVDKLKKVIQMLSVYHQRQQQKR